MEEIPSYLYPGLAQLQKRSGSEGKGQSSDTCGECVDFQFLFSAEVMQKLASWTVQCLSLELARQSPPSVSLFLLAPVYTCTIVA